MLNKFNQLRTHHQLTVALLVSFAVISFWRGLWGLMDIYLFPENEEISLWASVFIGLGILMLTGYATKELM